MKEYWSIPGWRDSALGMPCLAFEKLDGSNIRVEWRRKQGFYKYGSRTVLLDQSHPDLGEAIPLFEATLAEPLSRIFQDRKLGHVEQAIVYCEFYGPSSFAGQHLMGEQKTLTIIDVNIHKRGIVLPREFVKVFGALPVPGVVYEGNFNHEFIEDVRNGKYTSGEGVVAKGIRPNCKKEQHGLWMAKAKTSAWLEELKRRAESNFSLKQVLAENIREQLGGN